LPGRRIPRKAIANLVPDLVVEVISQGNTVREMERKLMDYFDPGVRLVWYVYPVRREVKVYTMPDRCRIIRESQTIRGGDVLAGFELTLRELFAEPKSGKSARK
jgi:Uma2 family endonuclease